MQEVKKSKKQNKKNISKPRLSGKHCECEHGTHYHLTTFPIFTVRRSLLCSALFYILLVCEPTIKITDLWKQNTRLRWIFFIVSTFMLLFYLIASTVQSLSMSLSSPLPAHRTWLQRLPWPIERPSVPGSQLGVFSFVWVRLRTV